MVAGRHFEFEMVFSHVRVVFLHSVVLLFALVRQHHRGRHGARQDHCVVRPRPLHRRSQQPDLHRGPDRPQIVVVLLRLAPGAVPVCRRALRDDPGDSQKVPLVPRFVVVGVRKEFEAGQDVVVGERPAAQGARGVRRAVGAETGPGRQTHETQTVLRLRVPGRVPLPLLVPPLRAWPVRVFERVHLHRRRGGLLRRVAVGRAVADLVSVGCVLVVVGWWLWVGGCVGGWVVLLV